MRRPGPLIEPSVPIAGTVCLLADLLTAFLLPLDLVARYGGEEFLVVLPDVSNRPGVARPAKAAGRNRVALASQDLTDAEATPLPAPGEMNAA